MMHAYAETRDAFEQGRVKVVMTKDGKDDVRTRRTRHGVVQRIPMSVFEVQVDGKPIGVVARGEATFERAPRGSRVVTKRWTNYRWFYSLTASPDRSDHYRRSTEYETKKGCVAALVELYFLRIKQAEEG